jgi:hypothetical protein
MGGKVQAVARHKPLRLGSILEPNRRGAAQQGNPLILFLVVPLARRRCLPIRYNPLQAKSTAREQRFEPLGG